MKVAIVHDYFDDYNGATKVVRELVKVFPNSDLYTLYVNKKEKKNLFLYKETNKVICSWLNYLPSIRKIPFNFSLVLFYSPFFWESLNLSDYDVVISSTFGFGAYGILTGFDTFHLCYIHTPSDRLYVDKIFAKDIFSNKKSLFLNYFLKGRRMWDFVAAQRPDVLVANSLYTQRRVKKFFRRNSELIYPPIKCIKTIKKKNNEEYYLYFGRLVKRKGLDLIIDTFNLNGKKLVIVGGGRDRLFFKKRVGGKNIEFKGFVEDKDLGNVLSNAKALVFVSMSEDFGMVLPEVMSLGVPIIAFDRGGPGEIVKDGKTGVLFDDYSIIGLNRAIRRFERITIKRRECVKRAEYFLRFGFEKRIKSLIEKGQSINY
ncbi:glycosyltransferase [Patescibacteria group bacterium]|nr:glycosyltransferase [Patescibacteria group bacterium]MCG2701643.1 glycosyltransferase [Candidatus Parcubacteria bacterium]MBU4265529.1 glycosyltransferase [Patescibacteria group bacterium]MBU4389857.1 glycosyltransferase [Patescibacteria group bacterium]MBU4397270.1 glycosyltransferase [Patescibacteria group bacterium]